VGPDAVRHPSFDYSSITDVIPGILLYGADRGQALAGPATVAVKSLLKITGAPVVLAEPAPYAT
jgi:hypothetical protein